MESRRSWIVSMIATGALGIGIALAGAQSASANTVTAYCQSVFYQPLAYSSQTLPNAAAWCKIQEGPATLMGYTGPVNGTPGPNTWKAVQKYLHDDGYGYTGPQNGIPGVNTYKAMQRAGVASGYLGYTGPIDGSLENRDWHAFIATVEVQFFGE